MYKALLDDESSLDYSMMIAGQEVYVWDLSRKAGLLGGMYSLPDAAYHRQPGVVDMHFEAEGDLVYTELEVEKVGPATILDFVYDVVALGYTRIQVWGNTTPEKTRLAQGEHWEVSRCINSLEVNAQDAVNQDVTEVSFAVRTKHLTENVWVPMLDSDYEEQFNSHPEIRDNPLYRQWFNDGEPLRTLYENPLDNPKDYWPYTLGLVGTVPGVRNVVATAKKSSEVELTWENDAGSAAGFEIWRGTVPGAENASHIHDVLIDEGPPYRFLDEDLTPNTWYFYHVRAFWEGKLVFSEFSSDEAFTSVILGDTRYGNARKLVCADGILHLTYSRDGQIWYRKSLNGGASWNEEELVSGGIPNCAHPSIALSPTGARCIAWDDGTCIYYAHTRQDGTWTSPVLIWEPSYVVGEASNPGIVIDDAGNAHMVWQAWADEIPYPRPLGFYFMILYATFVYDVIFPQQSCVYVDPDFACGYPSIACVGTTPHVIWEVWGMPFSEKLIYHSGHEGSSWSTALVLSDPGHESVNPSIGASESGMLFAVWADLTDGALAFRQYTGSTWDPRENVASIPSETYPVVLEGDGVPYVVWSDLDIYFSKRSGVDWSSPKKLAETVGSSGSPAIAYYHDPSMMNAYLYTAWLEQASWDDTDYVGFVSKLVAEEPHGNFGQGIVGPMTETVHGTLVPSVFALSQCYPNPFKDETVIRYQQPRERHVSIGVYDISGKLVQTLVNDTKEPGFHSVTWNRGQQPVGVYFCRLQAGEFTAARKLTLLR